MSALPPDWAINRALDLCPWHPRSPRGLEHFKVQMRQEQWPTLKNFAAYIARKEEPPVDPLLIEAAGLIQNWRDGGGGEDTALDTARLVVAALKRGMALAARGGEQ